MSPINLGENSSEVYSLKGIKMKNNVSKLVLALIAAALVSACSTPVKVEDKAPVADTSGATDTRGVEPVTGEVDPLNDPKGVLANRSVYFDFDKYDVKEEYNGMLSAHAKYLTSHSNRKIMVQGNTDERGGREYNLALGEKRAVAVTKSLSALGVAAGQMEAVSFGKEKPKAQGNDEAAWAENRRADIAY